jgi:hypothetical protein
LKSKIIIVTVIFSTFMLLILTGCDSSSNNEPTEKNMSINIKNNANFDFYGLEARILDYSFHGVANADGSKIEKGEILSFDFFEEDFPLEGEVEMEVFVMNNRTDGNSIPINKKITFELVNDQEILFELTGDSIKEADLERVK